MSRQFYRHLIDQRRTPRHVLNDKADARVSSLLRAAWSADMMSPTGKLPSASLY
jgi:hypothetical protein